MLSETRGFPRVIVEHDFSFHCALQEGKALKVPREYDNKVLFNEGGSCKVLLGRRGNCNVGFLSKVYYFVAPILSRSFDECTQE